MKIDMPGSVHEALERLENAGFEAYMVGGCVRDAAMGRAAHDYDITTSARPEQTLECFSGERVIPTGIKHGTVTVMLGGMPLEITTFRADGDYTDHRRPDSVNFSLKLEDDLCRRDFTVNAMAYSARRGLVDMYGGVDDIRRRVIRCVGDAHKRFGEDALRMLRAVRFAATLDFSIEDKTLNALNTLKGDISYVARERVYAEFNKAVMAEKPQYAFDAGRELVLLALGIAELPDYAAAVERMALTARVPELRWAALLAGPGADAAKTVLAGLKAPNAVISRACAAICNAERGFEADRISVLHLLNGMGMDGLNDALELARAQAVYTGDCDRRAQLDAVVNMANSLAAENACWSLKTLAINGKTLGRLGYSGKSVGVALNRMLELVIEGRLPNEPEVLEAFAADMQPMMF